MLDNRVIRGVFFVDMEGTGGKLLSVSGMYQSSACQPQILRARPREWSLKTDQTTPLNSRRESHCSRKAAFSALLNPVKILPLPAGVLGFFILFGAGFFDPLILPSNPVSFEAFPDKTESLVRINKAFINLPTLENMTSALVFTKHRIASGETLSRIAYKYGLSPSTLISINSLKTPNDVKNGTILVIPYIDGIRVMSHSGENLVAVAARYGSDPNNVQRIPGSKDYFIAGESYASNAPSSFTRDVFLYPVNGRILTAYGESEDTLTGIDYETEGLDLYAAVGTPVKASKDGTVILTGNHSFYGLYAIMAHPGGWKSFYGHLSRVDVAPGDKLKSGMTLGLAGRSGTVQSPRVYFALIHHEESVDPLDFLY